MTELPGHGFETADMLHPTVYPHPVGRLELVGTNTSWIVLTGLFAYKIKRGVRLGFVDMSALSRRRELCEEELRLNRRLAADLYVDVVPVSRTPRGLRVGDHGPIVEYAVRMNQFDRSQELAALLGNGTVEGRELEDLARGIADFHARAPRAIREPDHPHTRQLHDAVLGNLATLLMHRDAGTALPDLGALIDFTHDFLHGHVGALRQREQAGFIRECHGDLHSRNIVRWRGRLVPFDCLEFDPKLRWIDVMNDTAFLVMDLAAQGRRDLAFAFLNAYLEQGGDYEGLRLLPFYAVYRALVRAMVDSLAIEDRPAESAELRARLRRRVETAAQFMQPASGKPVLVIMHGPAGSGKSWMSHRLAGEMGAMRIRSDLERKRMHGGAVAGPAEFLRGIYTPEFSRMTYTHLRECALACLEGGVDTVVDAAFLDATERRAFRDLAERMGSPFVVVSLRAERMELERRIAGRRGTDPSDADLTVLEGQLRLADPLTADERTCSIEIDTRDEDVVARVSAAIRAQREAPACR